MGPSRPVTMLSMATTLLLFFTFCFPFTFASLESYENFVPVASSEAVADSYIVVLKDGTTSTLDSISGFSESYVKFRYNVVLNGYNLQGAPESVLAEILNASFVEAVYQDAKMYSILPNETDVEDRAAQSIGPWGLDRIDARKGLDGVFNYDATGKGVTVFIADGGIRSTHREFTGRYLYCKDYTGVGCGKHDEHGTHVAGTAVGTTYGVAKEASLVDLKVLYSTPDGATGFKSWFIAAMDELASLKKANPSAKYVLNASLGGAFLKAENTALANLVATGVTVVVAGGNENDNACKYSPSSEPKAITVGSTTIADARSSFSNYGACLDLFAPGSNILSASNTTDTSTAVLSGTSMASPLVAGIAAIMLELGLDPRTEIINVATPNVVTNAKSESPNRLAYLPRSSPTQSPTKRPTQSPVQTPTLYPTKKPTTKPPKPTKTQKPTPAPTPKPTNPAKTKKPTPVQTKSESEPQSTNTGNSPLPTPNLRPTQLEGTTPSPSISTNSTTPSSELEAGGLFSCFNGILSGVNRVWNGLLLGSRNQTIDSP